MPFPLGVAHDVFLTSLAGELMALLVLLVLEEFLLLPALIAAAQALLDQTFRLALVASAIFDCPIASEVVVRVVARFRIVVHQFHAGFPIGVFALMITVTPVLMIALKIASMLTFAFGDCRTLLRLFVCNFWQ